MNIAIGAASLCVGKGGTERVAVNLAHAMLERGHNIHIFSLDTGREPAYPLNFCIKLIRLSKEFGQGKFCEIEKVRNYLIKNNISIMLSMQDDWTHMLWCLTCLGTGVPIICSERSDPRISESISWNKPGRMAVLASCDAIHELLDIHVKTVPLIHQEKCFVIPNPAPKRYIGSNNILNKKNCTILFLARFIKTKRADLLIKAFAEISDKFPEWRLRIAGYGPEENYLRRLSSSLGVDRKIDFVINPKDVIYEYKNANIYCLPTKVEGFPNSLIEAMAYGIPSVGIKDCPAISSIIKDHENGILVSNPSPKLLGNALAELMSSPTLCSRIAENSIIECKTIYNQDFIWNLWEYHLNKISLKKGNTIMDSFSLEPFSSKAYLSYMARKEYIFKNFGDSIFNMFLFYFYKVLYSLTTIR